MVAIVGEGGLAPEDRRALAFADAFERELVGQGTTRRSLDETLEAGFRLLETLPAEDLTKLDRARIAGWRAARAAREARAKGGSGP
jgi:V/A-type H+-transporting ATPase subunit B